MQKRIVRQYMLLSFLFSAAGMDLIAAIYSTYLMKSGLNLFQINVVNATFFLTLFVCEIPTGAFADLFGRKKSFVISCAILAVSMFVYGLSSSFYGFILAEVIGGIGCTFMSGAFQAWFVDSMKHHGHDGDLKPIFAKNALICKIGSGIGAVSGSYLMAVSLSLPWIIAGFVMITTACIAWSVMREEYFKKQDVSWNNGWHAMKAIATSSIHYAIHDKAVRFILIISGIQIYSVMALNMFWQPFFKSHGVKEVHYGYVFVTMMAALALGNVFIARVKSHGKERGWIISVQCYVGATVIASALAPSFGWALTFFLLHEAGRGCWGPLITSYLHDRIPSHERATISSFCSIAPHIGGALGLLISGALAESTSISTAWIFSGAALILGALIVWKK